MLGPFPWWWWLWRVWAEVERVLEAIVSRPRLKKSQYVRERARFCVELVSGLVEGMCVGMGRSYGAENAKAELNVTPDGGPTVDPAEI